MEILIREFGYDKNDTINKAILDKVNKEYLSKQPRVERDLINLFARKDCYGNLQIRERLMRFILDNTTTGDNKYLNLLESFGSTLYSSSSNSKKMSESFSEQERLKILIYATYFIQKAYDLYWEKYSQNWAAVSLLYSLLSKENETSQKFLKQVRENNYYGLDGFEKMVNDMLQYIEDEPELHF